MPFTEPWSKKHKRLTRAGSGGLRYSLSNSYAQPLEQAELVELTKSRGDHALLHEYMHGHSLGYTPNGGSLDLREEIAKLYGPSIGADNILVFTGAQAALPTAAHALTNSDAHAIVFDPAYQSVQEAPLHAGCCQVTRLTLKAENGWQVEPGLVRAAIRPSTRYIVLNEPFNPAGTLMRREVQAELIEIASSHGIYILCDEVYRLLEHEGERTRLPAMADAYALGLSCVTMSKPWGACGVTIGWLAFRDLSIRQRLVDVQYFGTACPSRASELQALMVLRSSDAILARNIRIIRANAATLHAFMTKHAEWFRYVRPVAGAIAFIQFLGPWSTAELGERLAAAGIGIKPAYCFTDVVTDANDYFRVGFGEACFGEALRALEGFVQAHEAAWRAAVPAGSGGGGGGGVRSKL
jgi:aspartate/methionine/tyrosine aminotransferase